MVATPSMPSISAGLNTRIAELLSPRFGSMPGPEVVAKYFVEALSAIARENLPIKIYLDHRITIALAPLFKELGLRFKSVPVDRMEPPYIFLFIDDDTGRLVVETCDPSLKKYRFITRLDLFIDELAALLVQVKAKKKEHKREEEAKPEIDLFDVEPGELLKLLGEILKKEE